MQATIWDMDGVLIDSGAHHQDAWATTLAEEGFPLSDEMFRSTFGMTNDRVIRTLLGDIASDRVQAISDTKERRFREAFRSDPVVVSGALELAEALAAAGIRQAIASSAPPGNVELAWDLLGLEQHFTDWLSGYGMPSKPDPAVFNAATDLLGVRAADSVVLEDSHAGIAAGIAAGVRVVGIATTHDPDLLTAADLVVRSPAELTVDILRSLVDD